MAADICIDGQSIANSPMHQRSRLGSSYLPQEASIFRKLNVQDNMRAVLELQTDAQGKPLAKAEIEERLTSLLEELRVAAPARLARRWPCRAASAGAWNCPRPGHAAALYPAGRALCRHRPIAVIEIQRIIGFLKERGIGVLITDHNVRETLGICDHAFIISDGQVLAQGTPQEIVDNPDVRRVYLGEHFRM